MQAEFLSDISLSILGTVFLRLGVEQAQGKPVSSLVSGPG